MKRIYLLIFTAIALFCSAHSLSYQLYEGTYIVIENKIGQALRII